jgi:hypothetical protein
VPNKTIPATELLPGMLIPRGNKDLEKVTAVNLMAKGCRNVHVVVQGDKSNKTLCYDRAGFATVKDA